MADIHQLHEAITNLVGVCSDLYARLERQKCCIDALEIKLEALTARLGHDHIVVAQRTEDGVLWGWSAIHAAAWREMQNTNASVVQMAGPMTSEEADVFVEQLQQNMSLKMARPPRVR